MGKRWATGKMTLDELEKYYRGTNVRKIILPGGQVITHEEYERVRLILKRKHKCGCTAHVEMFLRKEVERGS